MGRLRDLVTVALADFGASGSGSTIGLSASEEIALGFQAGTAVLTITCTSDFDIPEVGFDNAIVNGTLEGRRPDGSWASLGSTSTLLAVTDNVAVSPPIDLAGYSTFRVRSRARRLFTSNAVSGTCGLTATVQFSDAPVSGGKTVEYTVLPSIALTSGSAAALLPTFLGQPATWCRLFGRFPAYTAGGATMFLTTYIASMAIGPSALGSSNAMNTGVGAFTAGSVQGEGKIGSFIPEMTALTTPDYTLQLVVMVGP